MTDVQIKLMADIDQALSKARQLGAEFDKIKTEFEKTPIKPKVDEKVIKQVTIDIDKLDAELKKAGVSATQYENTMRRAGRAIEVEMNKAGKAFVDGRISVEQFNKKMTELTAQQQKFNATGVSTQTRDLRVAVTNLGQGTDSAKLSWIAFTTSITAFKAVADSVIGALKGIYNQSVQLYELYRIQKDAEDGLAISMQNMGIYTKEAHDELLQFASARQAVTNFGDEVSLQLMSELAAMGLNTEEMKKAIIVSQDLATVKKMDLITAGRLIGKAFEGEYSMLKRYGIVLDDTRVKTEGVAYVSEEIGRRFRGQAEAMANPVKQLANAWGDMKEKIGEELAPGIEDLTKKIQGFIPTILSGVKTLYNLFNKIKPLIPGLLMLFAVKPALMLIAGLKKTAIGYMDAARMAYQKAIADKVAATSATVAGTATKAAAFSMATGIRAVGMAIAANPIGAILTAIAIAATTLIPLIQKLSKTAGAYAKEMAESANQTQEMINSINEETKSMEGAHKVYTGFMNELQKDRELNIGTKKVLEDLARIKEKVSEFSEGGAIGVQRIYDALSNGTITANEAIERSEELLKSLDKTALEIIKNNTKQSANLNKSMVSDSIKAFSAAAKENERFNQEFTRLQEKGKEFSTSQSKRWAEIDKTQKDMAENITNILRGGGEIADFTRERIIREMAAVDKEIEQKQLSLSMSAIEHDKNLIKARIARRELDKKELEKLLEIQAVVKETNETPVAPPVVLPTAEEIKKQLEEFMAELNKQLSDIEVKVKLKTTGDIGRTLTTEQKSTIQISGINEQIVLIQKALESTLLTDKERVELNLKIKGLEDERYSINKSIDDERKKAAEDAAKEAEKIKKEMEDAAKEAAKLKEEARQALRAEWEKRKDALNDEYQLRKENITQLVDDEKERQEILENLDQDRIDASIEELLLKQRSVDAEGQALYSKEEQRDIELEIQSLETQRVEIQRAQMEREIQHQEELKKKEEERLKAIESALDPLKKRQESRRTGQMTEYEKDVYELNNEMNETLIKLSELGVSQEELDKTRNEYLKEQSYIIGDSFDNLTSEFSASRNESKKYNSEIVKALNENQKQIKDTAIKQIELLKRSYGKPTAATQLSSDLANLASGRETDYAYNLRQEVNAAQEELKRLENEKAYYEKTFRPLTENDELFRTLQKAYDNLNAWTARLDIYNQKIEQNKDTIGLVSQGLVYDIEAIETVTTDFINDITSDSTRLIGEMGGNIGNIIKILADMAENGELTFEDMQWYIDGWVNEIQEKLSKGIDLSEAEKEFLKISKAVGLLAPELSDELKATIANSLIDGLYEKIQEELESREIERRRTEYQESRRTQLMMEVRGDKSSLGQGLQGAFGNYSNLLKEISELYTSGIMTFDDYKIALTELNKTFIEQTKALLENNQALVDQFKLFGKAKGKGGFVDQLNAAKKEIENALETVTDENQIRQLEELSAAIDESMGAAKFTDFVNNITKVVNGIANLGNSILEVMQDLEAAGDLEGAEKGLAVGTSIGNALGQTLSTIPIPQLAAIGAGITAVVGAVGSVAGILKWISGRQERLSIKQNQKVIDAINGNKEGIDAAIRKAQILNAEDLDDVEEQQKFVNKNIISPKIGIAGKSYSAFFKEMTGQSYKFDNLSLDPTRSGQFEQIKQYYDWLNKKKIDGKKLTDAEVKSFEAMESLFEGINWQKQLSRDLDQERLEDIDRAWRLEESGMKAAGKSQDDIDKAHLKYIKEQMNYLDGIITAWDTTLYTNEELMEFQIQRNGLESDYNDLLNAETDAMEEQNDLMQEKNDLTKKLLQQRQYAGAFGLTDVLGSVQANLAKIGIRSFDSGGYVSRDQLALVHKGETVIPANSYGGSMNISNINISGIKNAESVPAMLKREFDVLLKTRFNLQGGLSQLVSAATA